MFLLLCISHTLYAQTIKTYITNNWKNERYTNHADGTVTDNKTELMWKQCSEGLSGVNSCATGSAISFTWDAALQLAPSVVFAGYSDWRLPNIKELGSLIASDRHSPSINSVLFPNSTPSAYWSSSPSAINSDRSWLLDFYYNGQGDYDFRYNTGSVRLVRSLVSNQTPYLIPEIIAIVAEGVVNSYDALTSPNGGEVWLSGINETIRWSNTLISGNTVDLYVIHDDWTGLLNNTSQNVGSVINSKKWYKFASNVENTGSYLVDPADLFGNGSYLILVVSLDDNSKFDISNELFSL